MAFTLSVLANYTAIDNGFLKFGVFFPDSSYELNSTSVNNSNNFGINVSINNNNLSLMFNDNSTGYIMHYNDKRYNCSYDINFDKISTIFTSLFIQRMFFGKDIKLEELQKQFSVQRNNTIDRLQHNFTFVPDGTDILSFVCFKY
jgi:hypothetical protein